MRALAVSILKLLKETFQMGTSLYKSDLNETDQSFDWLLISQSLTIYRAYIAHQKEPIYGLSKESKFFS